MLPKKEQVLDIQTDFSTEDEKISQCIKWK